MPKRSKHHIIPTFPKVNLYLSCYRVLTLPPAGEIRLVAKKNAGARR